MEKAEIEGYAGVALFSKSPEADLKAFEWAYKHLRLSKKYKLRIIHVDELNDGGPRERPDSRYEYDDLETKFKENYPDCKMDTLQSDILKIKKYICGVTYEGENFESALQHAIEKEGLDTLVLACWVAEDNTKGLESEGCSIVHAKVDSRKLTFSMPSTEGSAATAGAPPMASPITNQRSNKINSSTSKAKTQCPNRETEETAATLPALPTEVSASITAPAPPPAPKKGSNSGSETDTPRRPSRREKDPAHDQPAEPSSRGKTSKIK